MDPAALRPFQPMQSIPWTGCHMHIAAVCIGRTHVAQTVVELRAPGISMFRNVYLYNIISIYPAGLMSVTRMYHVATMIMASNVTLPAGSGCPKNFHAPVHSRNTGNLCWSALCSHLGCKRFAAARRLSMSGRIHAHICTCFGPVARRGLLVLGDIAISKAILKPFSLTPPALSRSRFSDIGIVVQLASGTIFCQATEQVLLSACLTLREQSIFLVDVPHKVASGRLHQYCVP